MSVKTIPLPESSPVSTHGPSAAEKAIASLVEKAVPPEYAGCLPEHVPELSGFSPDGSYGVCFRGDTGIGKTYAATALAIKMAHFLPMRTNPATGEAYFASDALRWVSSPYLLARIRSTFRNNARESEIDVIDEFIGARILVLDDLGAEKTTEFTGASLYTIISGRRNHWRQTIVTTNQTLDEINEWEPRIASRLGEMQSVILQNRDWRMMKRRAS